MLIVLRLFNFYLNELLFLSILSGGTCVTRRFWSLSSVLVFSVAVAYGFKLEWAEELFLLLVLLLLFEVWCDDELEISIFGSLLSTFRFSIY